VSQELLDAGDLDAYTLLVMGYETCRLERLSVTTLGSEIDQEFATSLQASTERFRISRSFSERR